MLYNKVKRHAYVLGPSAVRSLAALRAPAATGPRGVASTSPVQIASAQFSTWQTVFWGNSCPRTDRARERPGVQHRGGIAFYSSWRTQKTNQAQGFIHSIHRQEGSGDMSKFGSPPIFNQINRLSIPVRMVGRVATSAHSTHRNQPQHFPYEPS